MFRNNSVEHRQCISTLCIHACRPLVDEARDKVQQLAKLVRYWDFLLPGSTKFTKAHDALEEAVAKLTSRLFCSKSYAHLKNLLGPCKIIIENRSNCPGVNNLLNSYNTMPAQKGTSCFEV